MVSKAYPTGIQPKKGKKPLKNSAVSKVSNDNNDIAYQKINTPKYGPGDNNRDRVGYPGYQGPDLEAGEGPSPLGGEPKKGGIQLAVSNSKKARFVALNENGTQRIGEDHARAILTDAQVEAIRDEYEAYPPGHALHVGYRLLAKKYGCSKRTVRDIVNYTKRNQWAARWKKIEPPK